jgi:hypothetical protein
MARSGISRLKPNALMPPPIRVRSVIPGLDAVAARLDIPWTADNERAVAGAIPESAPLDTDDWSLRDPLPDLDPRVAAAIDVLASHCLARGDDFVAHLTDNLLSFPSRRFRHTTPVVTRDDWVAFLRIWSGLAVRSAVDFAGWWNRQLRDRRALGPEARGRRSHADPPVDSSIAASVFSGAVD